MSDIITDRTGFPMIKVNSLNAYIHFYPVTKIQFEYCLSSGNFDDAWYDDILQLNPRISPNQIRHDNYWKVFMTGILPSEANRFAEWCGEDFAIPTLDEWFTAYKELKDQPPISIDELLNYIDTKPRSRVMMKNLDKAPRSKLKQLNTDMTLGYQMFLRRGVIEWVDEVAQRVRWGGMGHVNRDFNGLATNPDLGEPTRPRDPENTRLFYYGFRLVKRIY